MRFTMARWTKRVAVEGVGYVNRWFLRVDRPARKIKCHSEKVHDEKAVFPCWKNSVSLSNCTRSSRRSPVVHWH
jgi:hypothetical protein